MLHSLGKIVLVITLFLSLPSFGQDPVFAQYFLNQNYLNPAFAGYTNDLTVNFNSRAQYLRVPGMLMSHTASANISCEEETRLGLAILAYNHIEGEGYLNSVNLSGQVSANFPFKYKVSRSRSNRGLFSGGVQFGAGQKFINWDRLTFSDQYSPFLNGIQNPSNVGQQERASNIYLDAAVGIRMSMEYGSGKRPKFLSLGASVFHINRPKQTFFDSRLPLAPRYSFYAFTYIGNNKRGRSKDLRYLTIGALADYQQGLQSHTISVYKDANELLTMGVSLRRQNFILIDRNVDAVIPHILLNRIKLGRLNDLTIGVSYELTVSTLGEEQTFGTVEIGIKWRFGERNLCRSRRKLCPVKGFDMGHDLPNIYF